MQTRTVAPNLKALTAEAKRLLAELEIIDADVRTKLTAGVEKSWQLGRALTACKGLVGHGNWLVWIEANLPVGARQAQRHMELAAANPDAQAVADLTPDSVRKFCLRVVPDKERPELAGDESLPRVCHHLTILNDFRRFQRRVEIGQAKLDADEAKRDLAPVFQWLCGLYGVKFETLN